MESHARPKSGCDKEPTVRRLDKLVVPALRPVATRRDREMADAAVATHVSLVRAVRYATAGAMLALALGWASPGAAVPMLTGTWMLREGTTTTLVDVEQNGDAVSFTYGGVQLTGAVSAAGRLRAMGGTLESTAATLDGDVSNDGTLLNAAVLFLTTSPVLEPRTTYLFGM